MKAPPFTTSEVKPSQVKTGEVKPDEVSSGETHADFEVIVLRIIHTIEKSRLTDLRRDFHTRLRITLTQPDDSALVEDLWDFFYDWCIFEQKIPESLQLSPEEQLIWDQVKSGNHRGLFTVQSHADTCLKLKDLYYGKSLQVFKRNPRDFLGVSRGDIVEGRLVSNVQAGSGPSRSDGKEASAPLLRGGFPPAKGCGLVRRLSFHPVEVHPYLKAKIRQFRKSKDFTTYQSWLWLLVGMYLKHRIYPHMPIEKIYDDNSRI